MDNIHKKNNTTIAMVVFFLGIFMGALDTGIISPARGVIASNLNISQSTSIWMVTIYTLVEAVSMPITGKLADRMGRKRIYITCIILFITGSILCWVSNVVENYNLLLIARAIQALGGGGVMPVATASIGSSFPIEKRGTAFAIPLIPLGTFYKISFFPLKASFDTEAYKVRNICPFSQEAQSGYPAQ
jgi:MFS family permease